MHRNTSCAVCSSRCAKGRTQRVGSGDRHRHRHRHIYIYNSDSLYKVGEEKREGGTLLGHHTDDVARAPCPTGPQPCLLVGLAGSHLVGVRVVGSGRVLSLRLIHGALRSPHGCVLGRLLHMRVLPCSGGPLLLSFAEAASAAPVELMDLEKEP